jgi:hypothetical protein
MDQLVEYIVLFLETIIIPWIISIDRRLSRVEGYLKRINGDR